MEAEELEKQLYAELEGLPKTGRQFVAAIRTLLKRETRSVAVSDSSFSVLPAGAGPESGVLKRCTHSTHVFRGQSSIMYTWDMFYA